MKMPDPFVTRQRLYDREIWWRDRQPFLQSKGYMLRPRFRPNWVPSWLTSGKHPYRSEDGILLPMASHLIDATRLSDGKMVYIKRINAGNREASIATSLYDESLRNDPTNHTVPILEVFSDPDTAGLSYMVMPFLRFPEDPPFETVSEVVDFVDQILEGLVFMHDQGVAHRDCCMGNIMMDASEMYPDGFHPVNMDDTLEDGFIRARVRPRSQVSIKYYFIDYGISSVFAPGQPRGLVTGTDGRDQDVPELSDIAPYDPFAVDVFLIGNLLRKAFLEKYHNTEFLRLLVLRATHPVPSSRPNARELLELWTVERGRISFLSKAWRLQGRNEFAVETAARDCVSMVRTMASYAWSFARWK
ncbi:hypothetical protein PENSPDRAFT_666269 [Peniophora sp. CONT]|nr:hypothetical protein PENSPDRAFT_666269 [Peniophora sp. CONT]